MADEIQSLEKDLAEATADAEEQVEAATANAGDESSSQKGNDPSSATGPDNNETEINNCDAKDLAANAAELDGQDVQEPTADADRGNEINNTEASPDLKEVLSSSSDNVDQPDAKPDNSETEDAQESDEEAVDSDAEWEYDEDNYAKAADTETEDTKTRYEISNLIFHLQKVEALWDAGERTGSKWTEFWVLVDKFFKPDSRAFKLWARKYTQIWGGFMDSEASTLTPFHVVATFGLVSIFHLLKEAPEEHDEEATTAEGRHPLHFAARPVASQTVKDKTDIIRCFLESGANPNAFDSRQWLSSPFHTLLYHNPDAELVKLFIKHGADVNAPNTTGISPLHFLTTEITHLDAVRALIHAGADLKAQDSGHETPLHWILAWPNSSNIRQEFVKLAIEHKADIDAEDMESQRKCPQSFTHTNQTVQLPVASILSAVGSGPLNLRIDRTFQPYLGSLISDQSDHQESSGGFFLWREP